MISPLRGISKPTFFKMCLEPSRRSKPSILREEALACGVDMVGLFLALPSTGSKEKLSLYHAEFGLWEWRPFNLRKTAPMEVA